MLEKKVSDPENYYKLSEPFENSEQCNEMLEGFYNEIAELRKKYRIRDLLIVTNGSVRYDDGKIGEFLNHSSFGSEIKQEILAAYAYGQTQSEHRELINKLLATKGTKNV